MRYIVEAKENCHYCGGSGFVTDWVPYGSTNVPMETECGCVEDNLPDDFDDDSDEVFSVVRAGTLSGKYETMD